MTVAQNLLHVWVWFMGWFKPVWIKFCRWLIGMPAWVPAASEQVHKVVVIGDGLAMGIGDRVILGSSGGIASRMQDEAATVRPGKKRPRTRWYVYNCGEANSTTFDWLPNPKDGENKGFYHKVFGDNNGCYGRDAEIVIVMLGTQDILRNMDGMSEDVLARPPPGQQNLRNRYKPEDYCSTVANLREICTALLLSHPNRRVILCDVMSMKDYRVTRGRYGEVLYRLNFQLIDMIADLGDGKGAVVGGLTDSDPTDANCTARQTFDFGKRKPIWSHISPPKITTRSWARCGDLTHLSARGYKELAKWLLGNSVIDAMFAVELNWWEKKIGLGKKK